LGIGEGDTVALWAENRIEWAVTQTALAAIGAVLVPINTHFREQDLRYVLNHSQAKAILFSKRFRSSNYLDMVTGQQSDTPSLQHMVCFDAVDRPGIVAYETLLEGHDQRFVPARTQAKAMGSVQYTSGTTGQPKGAALSFGGMMLNAAASAKRLKLSHGDRLDLHHPPLSLCGLHHESDGLPVPRRNLCGVPAFDAQDMFRIIESERCTLLTGVPTSYLSMLQHPDRQQFDLSTLRAGTCGGSDCDPGVLARCAAEFPIPITDCP